MERKANWFVVTLVVLAVIVVVYGLGCWAGTINWQAYQDEGRSGLVGFGFGVCCGICWITFGLLSSILEGVKNWPLRRFMMIYGLFSLLSTLLNAVCTGYYDDQQVGSERR